MHQQPLQLIAALALAASCSVWAQDATLLGLQLGKSTLQDVLGRLGIAPLRHGDVDELCYRSENPLQATWVLFGAGESGDWERLTQIRAVTSEPAGITCRPHPSIPSLGELQRALGPSLEVKLTK